MMCNALNNRSLLLAVLGVLLLTPLPGIAESTLHVYKARSVITMDASLPRAEAVAVANGRIVAVGSSESIRPWLQSRPHVIDERFEDKVIIPGLIDNHLHPQLAALLLNTHWITPHDWDLPGWQVPRTRGRDEYLKVLRLAIDDLSADGEPFITWGYHEIWHGDVNREELDRISKERPIIVWQRSFHEVIANTAGIKWLGIDPAKPSPHAEVDLERGAFSEQGMIQFALAPLSKHLLQPEKLARGHDRLRDVIWRGGITTIADMGGGGYPMFEHEVASLTNSFGDDDTPFRTMVVPAIANTNLGIRLDQLADELDTYPELSTHRIIVKKHVKFLADGAFFAQYMRMNPPGYTDGHEGKWLTEPDELLSLTREFWNRGYQIHIHVNGDEGVDVVLDTLQILLDEKPRADHRMTLHHVGYATNDQLRRAAELRVVISAQPYYLWALGDAYAREGLGADRASQISRIGGMLRHGIPVSLHSDFTMAPAAPLTLASVAVNRITAEGTLMAPKERITVEQALRAVTIDAAYALSLEQEIGSIVAGKRADFTVLEADPLAIDPTKLKDIVIWGTVFEGRIFPLKQAPQ
jgi:predicted amidohydrolase YtcJ